MTNISWESLRQSHSQVPVASRRSQSSVVGPSRQPSVPFASHRSQSVVPRPSQSSGSNGVQWTGSNGVENRKNQDFHRYYVFESFLMVLGVFRGCQEAPKYHTDTFGHSRGRIDFPKHRNTSIFMFLGMSMY